MDPKTKRGIVVGILTLSKTGTDIKKLNREFETETGEKIAATKQEAIALLKEMDGVYCDENGKYFSNSEKSYCIAKFVDQQREGKSPHFSNNTFRSANRFNASRWKPVRAIVNYSDLNNSNDQPPTSGYVPPAKIQNRRKTTCNYRSPSPNNDWPPRRRNSFAERENVGNKRRRSRSRSPPYRSNRDRSRSRSRSRSVSRTSNRDNSPKRHRRQVSSPSRRSNHVRSPLRSSRSRSPIRRKRSRSPTPRSRRSRSPTRNRRSGSPSKKNRFSHSPTRQPPTPKVEEAVKPKFSPKPSTSATANASSRQPDTNPLSQPSSSAQEDTKKEVKPKRFKFSVVGDGYIYHLLSDMQVEDIRSSMATCRHNLSIDDAIKMIDIQKDRLKQRNKRVLISIGATDLRGDKKMFDMKRDFTRLFLMCDEYGLRPLITTILCFDTPAMKRKADCFNEFLLKNFINVVDMREVGRCGLAEALSTVNAKNIIRNKSLEVGRLQQLVLNIRQ